MRPALRLRELNCTSSSWTHSSHEVSSCDLQLFTIYFYYLWKLTNLLCSGLCCIYIEVSQGQRMIFQTWFYICQLSRFYIHLIFACCFMCFNLFFFFFFLFLPFCHQCGTCGFLIILTSFQPVCLLNLPERWQSSELRLQPDLVYLFTKISSKKETTQFPVDCASTQTSYVVFMSQCYGVVTQICFQYEGGNS